MWLMAGCVKLSWSVHFKGAFTNCEQNSNLNYNYIYVYTFVCKPKTSDPIFACFFEFMIKLR